MAKTELNSRLYLVFLFFAIVFFALVSRLIYVQVIRSAEFKEYASQQHNIFTEIASSRGFILDRNSRALAINAVSYSIFATNQLKVNKELTDKIAALLKLNSDALFEKLSFGKSFVWLKRKADPEVSDIIKQWKLEGIGQIRENKRFYPNGSTASHVIGFTDIDNKGLEGVEVYCDSYLTGLKGWRLTGRDAKQREILCWGYKSILPTDGYDVVLTIDSVIQAIAERKLREAVKKYKASSATVIVLRPKTGEILALCNYPEYNLNNINDCPAEARRNLAVTDMFEPGSSFKFVTAACALEEGKAALEDKIFCEQGQYRTGGRILHDYRPYGELSFEQVIAHSSNIGVAKIAEKVGSRILYKYIKSFGFGDLTGIELPGEVSGILRSVDKWSSPSLTSIAMGQEVAVTPIQLICAISVIANDGILIKPKIINYIQRKDGTVIKSFPVKEVRRVISAQTAGKVKQALVQVVEEGTGKKARVSGYNVAGKTGTAQKAKPDGGYYKNRYCATFVGFLPVEDPEIAILVVLNEPYPRYFGGTVCAPVFSKIAVETLRYLEMSDL